MLLNKLKAFLQLITDGYQRLEHFFTSGSFGIKFYPFLMHPVVRHSRSGVIKGFSVLAIFCGLFYFFGELITILFSEASLAAYYKHTTLELLLPLDSVVDAKKSTLSPLSYTMRSQFLLQGWFFILFYFFCVTQITNKRLRLLSVVLSLFFTLGASIIYSSQGGQYTEGGLQNLGFESTFIVGNLAMIIIAFAIESHLAQGFKKYSLIAGSLGLVAMAVPLFVESSYTPLLERISIYALMAWEIMLGFAVLREME